MNGLIGLADKMAHAVVDHVVFVAREISGLKGTEIYPLTGRGTRYVSTAEIKAAFIAKNGGRFIRNRWYK